jgi:bacillolysin
MLRRRPLVALAAFCASMPLIGNAQTDDAATRSAIGRLQAAAGPKALRLRRAPGSEVARFMSARGGAGIAVTGSDASARASDFLRRYGRAFGAPAAAEFARYRDVERDSLGTEHVRMQQMFHGIPVVGAEMIVHLRGSRVIAANGKTLSSLAGIVTEPAIGQARALEVVRGALAKHQQVTDAVLSTPQLQVLDVALLGGPGRRRALTWFVEATKTDLRRFYWIDARGGVVALEFSQLPDAGKSRKIYTTNNSAKLPGSLKRSEGKPPTGDPDMDLAYDYAGDTYDYYFTQHGRSSFDGKGGVIISTTHYCPSPASCPYQNAFWNGKQMVYGEGFPAADDVDAHELTHAVTERTAGLFYYMQSGALNESFSDIFGETVDLTNGKGDDSAPARWFIGEDVPSALIDPPPPGAYRYAIRSMADPTIFDNPGKVSDSQLVCVSPEPLRGFGDAGGVHQNSGVPNHAYELMVDGGTYNGRTVVGIGLSKAAKVQYRALTTYLSSASDFRDDYDALKQSCEDLIGAADVSASDCLQVGLALDAVEMSDDWPCAPAQAAVPAYCPAGQGPVDFYADDMEKTSGKWTTASLIKPGYDAWTANYFAKGTGSPKVYFQDYAKSETHHLWASDFDFISDSVVTMSKSVTIPPGARMQFDHSYGFDNDAFFSYDGGVIEGSLDNGRTWGDAGGLISAGASYGGFLESIYGNPLGGRPAFVRDSWGYTATQLNLSGLAGGAVRFRFRVGSDNLITNYGWFIDNVRMYTCDVGGSLQLTPTAVTVKESGKTAKFTVTRTGGLADGVTVDYETADDTATAGEDYVATSGKLSFGSGETNKTFTIPILNDTKDDPGQVFDVFLTNPQGPTVSLGANNAATIAITDDDVPGVIQLAAVKYTVSEAKPAALIAVTRTGGAASDVTVHFSTSPGTATANVDYTTTAGTLTFGARATRMTISVPINNDTVDEPNETFTIALDTPGGGATLGAKQLATVTIVDNDKP